MNIPRMGLGCAVVNRLLYAIGSLFFEENQKLFAIIIHESKFSNRWI
jgi:hypothetical protein